MGKLEPETPINFMVKTMVSRCRYSQQNKTIDCFKHLEKYEFVSWEGRHPIYEMEPNKMFEATNQLSIRGRK
jgi:hypothetical protein